MTKKKFSNVANKRIAEKNGATLISYTHNPGESLREKAVELHRNSKIVYYENSKNGSFLYEVDNNK